MVFPTLNNYIWAQMATQQKLLITQPDKTNHLSNLKPYYPEQSLFSVTNN